MSRRSLLALVVVAMCAFDPFSPSVRAGSDTNSSRDAHATKAIEDLGLSADTLSARIESVRADETLTPEARELALASYTSAIDALQSAEALEFKTRKFLRLSDEAAAHLRRINEAKASPPKFVAPASLDELEARANDLNVRLADTRAELDEVTVEQQRRATRRVEIPARRSELRRKLIELRAGAGAGPSVAIAASGEPARARAVRGVAEEYVVELEIAALDAEVVSYDARRELLALRRDLGTREMTSLEAEKEQLQTLVDQARKTDAERAASVASGAEEAARDAHPLLRAAAARNAELALARTGPDGIGSRLERARAFADRIAARDDTLSNDFAAVQERVKLVGFSGPVGALLRKQKTELPDKSFHRGKIRARQEEIGTVQLELLELEDDRAALSDPMAKATATVAEEAPDLDAGDAQRLTADLQPLLEARRGYLDALLDDYDAYFLTLIELDTKERELLRATSEFGAYIETHVLWIRSTKALNAQSLTSAAEALAWIVRPEHAKRAVTELQSVPSRSPLLPISAFLFVAVIFVARRRVTAYCQALHDTEVRDHRAQLRPLLVSIVAAVLSAIRWPVVMWVLAWLLDEATGDHARASSAGLEAAASALFIFGLARQIFRPDGMGVHHFGWDSEATASVRHHLTSALVGIVPAVFIINMMQNQPSDGWKESLGRIAFIFTVGCVALFGYRTLRPNGSFMRVVGGENLPSPYLYWVRRLFAPVIIGSSLFVGLLATLGYYFAALSLAPHVMSTIRLIFAVILGRAVALRWIGIARLRADTSNGAAMGDLSEEAVPQVAVATDQDRRLVGNIAAFVAVVGVLLIWKQVFPAFNVFNNVQLWSVNTSYVYEVTTNAGTESHTGVKELPITLGSLVQAILVFGVALSAAKHLPGLLDISVLRRLRLEAGVSNAITTILGYGLVVVGVVGAAGRLGLAWAQVQWLAAAVSVGLGFGLQEIFANFVSGIIILFERPIRIDDTVTLGGITGTVSRINIRATTIVDWDNKELVVPNKEFVTGQLINWTLSNPTLRLIIPVGIAYGSDTKLAETTLLETAAKNPNVIDDPKPNVVFSGFGDNSLNFELRVYVPHIRYLVQTRHQLHMKIDEAFRAAGIEISFPQRDLHLRTIASPIPVRIET